MHLIWLNFHSIPSFSLCSTGSANKSRFGRNHVKQIIDMNIQRRPRETWANHSVKPAIDKSAFECRPSTQGEANDVQPYSSYEISMKEKKQWNTHNFQSAVYRTHSRKKNMEDSPHFAIRKKDVSRPRNVLWGEMLCRDISGDPPWNISITSHYSDDKFPKLPQSPARCHFVLNKFLISKIRRRLCVFRLLVPRPINMHFIKTNIFFISIATEHAITRALLKPSRCFVANGKLFRYRHFCRI